MPAKALNADPVAARQREQWQLAAQERVLDLVADGAALAASAEDARGHDRDPMR